MPQPDPDDEALHMRPTRINGERFADDYQVIWQDLPIGRILKQDGIPSGRPAWWFGVDVYGKPQPPDNRGTGATLKECQTNFKAVWARVRAELSYDDITRAKRHLAALDERMKR